MGIVERRQRQKEIVKGDILCAAWNLVEKEGWQSLSIRKIAEAIEYSVPVIYDHFENKEALYLEFAKKGFRILTEKIISTKNQSSDPSEQIKGIADAYWEFALNNTELYQLMFGIGMPCCEIAKAMPEREAFRNNVIEPIESLISASGREDMDSCLKYHTLWSILHGLISMRIVGNSAIDDKLNKLVIEDAINGFIKNMS